MVVESRDADDAMYPPSPKFDPRTEQPLGLFPAQRHGMVSRWDRFIRVHDSEIHDGEVAAVRDIRARGGHNQ